jgi:4'-phosphopantetheinyl transferase
MGLSDHGFEITVTHWTDGGVLEPVVASLELAEIHLWEFPLAVSDPVRATLQAWLSEEERARASRFHFEADARRFAVARGSLRSILGAYSGSAACDLKFVYSQPGKPRLADERTRLRFNLSHSGERGLLAVASGREVGADIEAMRKNVEFDQLAERFFSEHERDTLRRLPPEKKVPAFYRCWTSKEAFLKALGIGLSRSLSSFDVALVGPAGLLATRPDPAEARLWSLFEHEAAAGYAAAVAVEGTIARIRVWRCC